MTSGRRVLATTFLLIGLPATIAAVKAVVFFRANASNGSFVSAGRTRDYLLYVPRRYDSAKATALVISLHGAGFWGAAEQKTSGWNRVADREGFIVVYPSGFRGSGPRIWHIDGEPGRTEDVRFISDLIDTLAAHYRLDRSRVYVNGLSAGGGMSWVLSCTLADRIAAVGLVAPAIVASPDWCTERRPMPMIDFHGANDWQIPYRGGSSAMVPGGLPSVERFVERWSQRNGCRPAPIDSVVNALVRRRSYGGCAAGADVVLYTVKDGGHTWPGGTPLAPWFTGRTSQAIDATEETWTFFKAHPRRQ